MKPIHGLIGFILLIVVLASLPKSESDGAPKPEPPKKTEPKLILKSEQCVSCEDLAEVQSELDAAKKRLSSVERDVAWLNSRVNQSVEAKAKVKLIPTTPTRKPTPAKSASTKPAMGSCSNGSCSSPFNYGRRGGRRR